MIVIEIVSVCNIYSETRQDTRQQWLREDSNIDSVTSNKTYLNIVEIFNKNEHNRNQKFDFTPMNLQICIELFRLILYICKQVKAQNRVLA